MSTSLVDFGLTPIFANQVSAEELRADRVQRVIEVQRSVFTVSNGEAELTVDLTLHLIRANAEERPTVGDWVLLDERRQTIERLLNRKSVIQRVAAGDKAQIQLVAANVDVLFVVTSCNDEFSESRLERYLAMASEAGVVPVVVLTKIDTLHDPLTYVERVRGVQPGIAIEKINARDRTTFDGLMAWVKPASTIALVGSSGVGKSSLVNALMGADVAATSEIRKSDSKGRHTTSHRALFRLPGGALLADLPGMRELKIANVDDGLGDVFDEIERLAETCNFSNCRHEAEPDCTVKAALQSGEIDERRYQNYLNLLRENARHTASLAESRAKGRDFAKHVKQAKHIKKQSRTKE